MLGSVAPWSVHVLTASGAVVGTMALAAIHIGAWSRAALLMLAALCIDAVDGTFARRLRAAERLPHFDGRRLDDIVDYFNYVLVPVCFLMATGHIPSWPWIIPPILASAYGFCQAEAKTADHFFLGFPSYWNAVALYLWLLDASPGIGAGLVLLLSGAVFVPLKYVYPSRSPRLRRTTVALGALWLCCLAAAAAARTDIETRRFLVALSLLYPAYYLSLSAWLGGWLHRRGTTAWGQGRRRGGRRRGYSGPRSGGVSAPHQAQQEGQTEGHTQ